jgi:Flp pilus assembly protein CpaB
VSAVITLWVAPEPTSRVVVAAQQIPEGATITVGMLEERDVPTRFWSKRKLGVASAAGVMGQEALHPIGAGDFIAPTHFGTRPDACVLHARALARQFAVGERLTGRLREATRGGPLSAG